MGQASTFRRLSQHGLPVAQGLFLPARVTLSPPPKSCPCRASSIRRNPRGGDPQVKEWNACRRCPVTIFRSCGEYSGIRPPRIDGILPPPQVVPPPGQDPQGARAPDHGPARVREDGARQQPHRVPAPLVPLVQGLRGGFRPVHLLLLPGVRIPEQTDH
jgi:hypothetical protein